MSQKYLKYRQHAYHRQNGRCFYCTALMWLGKSEDFVATHNLSKGEAARLQCTAEHLKARQDGGSDAQGNIVAACWFCNWARHARPNPLAVDDYRHLVHRRLKKSKWHPGNLHKLLALP